MHVEHVVSSPSDTCSFDTFNLISRAWPIQVAQLIATALPWASSMRAQACARTDAHINKAQHVHKREGLAIKRVGIVLVQTFVRREDLTGEKAELLIPRSTTHKKNSTSSG